jgi:type IV secretory pathway TraG/TraD family ATPase VirD4
MEGISEFMLAKRDLLLAFPPAWPAWWVLTNRAEKEQRLEVLKIARAYDPKPLYGARLAFDEMLRAAGAMKKGPLLAGYTKSGIPFYNNPAEGQYKPEICFGPMGSLKTNSFFIPRALSWPFSMAIFEATGETAMRCAHYRRRYGDVLIFNPNGSFRPYLEGEGLTEVCYNPLADMDPFDPALDTKVSKIAGAALEKQHGRDRYWDITSQDLIETLMMSEIELRKPGTVTLPRIAEIVYTAPRQYCRWALNYVRNAFTRLRLIRYAYANDEIKSLHEVLQNTCTQLKPFMSPAVARALSRNDFSCGSLLEEVKTVIVIGALEHMGAHNTDRLRSFLLECFLAEVQSERFKKRVPVQFQVDELGQQPPSEAIRQCMSSLRKFNAFMSVAINDYGTLCDLYGERGADTFINNAGLVQWVARDVAGSEMVSRLAGKTDVKGYGKTINSPAALNWEDPADVHMHRMSVTETLSQQQRDLILAQEVREMSLASHDQIVFMDGVPSPILCERRPFFRIPELRRKARRSSFDPPESFWKQLLA